jgi:hypothetical protein
MLPPVRRKRLGHTPHFQSCDMHRRGAQSGFQRYGKIFHGSKCGFRRGALMSGGGNKKVLAFRRRFHLRDCSRRTVHQRLCGTRLSGKRREERRGRGGRARRRKRLPLSFHWYRFGPTFPFQNCGSSCTAVDRRVLGCGLHGENNEMQASGLDEDTRSVGVQVKKL